MAKNGYIPRYMKSVFNGSTRNLGFSLNDFVNYNDDEKGSKRTNALIRFTITGVLFEEYNDRTLIAFFTGVKASVISQWISKYYKRSNDPLIPILRSKILRK